jgi:hypothetical protein
MSPDTHVHTPTPAPKSPWCPGCAALADTACVLDEVASGQIPEPWLEWWLERASILEYDAFFARADAEREATRLLLAYLAQKGIAS